MIFRTADRKSKARKVPKAVSEYMHRRYIMLTDYIDMLRCFEDDCILNGESVRSILIFDPRRARKKNLSINSRADIETYPELLLFKGHIDRPWHRPAVNANEKQIK